MDEKNLTDKVDSSTNCHIKDTQQIKSKKRLQWYIHYIVKYFEEHMSLFLQILENEDVQNKSNSKLTVGASAVASLIPACGKQIGSALKESELFCYNQMIKRKSRALVELITYFRDNKYEARSSLIRAGAYVFAAFEPFFVQFTCKGGNARAMQKLGEDAIRRLFDYTIHNTEDINFNMHFFGKGIIKGDSKTILKKSGRSVYIKDTLYKTFNVYDKSGIFHKNEKSELIFKNKTSNNNQHFYRKLLPWEKIEDFNDWSVKSNLSYSEYNYVLEIEDSLLNDLEIYILNQSKEGEAKLERKNYHEENLKHQDKLHERTNEYLSGQLEEFYNGLNNHLIELEKTIKNKNSSEDAESSQNNEDINLSLTEVKYYIDENNQFKVILQEQTNLIIKDLEEIKKKQNVKNLVVNEVKKILPPKREIEKVVEKVNKSTQSGVKEVEKAAHKIVRETDKSAKSVRKALKKIKF